MEKKNKAVFVVGPTASGKSALGLKIAEIFSGEIVSCDSMQIYRKLNIGTAKESLKNRERIPHHMIDVVDYDADFSVAEYQKTALQIISDIWSRGKLPVIVGGTGLYVESLIRPMSFSKADKDDGIRRKLESDLEKYGEIELYRRLNEVDAETAKKLHPNDTKRVIRALEIFLKTGIPKSEQADKITPPPFDYLMLGLDMDRALLYSRIDERVDVMFEEGLALEVLSINDFSLQSMQAIGYKEFADYNGFNVEEIKEKIKKHSRNYAKRQLTWFRRYKEINWINPYDDDSAVSLVKRFLSV